MIVRHTLVNDAQDGLSAVRATQAGWSPHLGHFASSEAMHLLRPAVKEGCKISETRNDLETVGQASLVT